MLQNGILLIALLASGPAAVELNEGLVAHYPLDADTADASGLGNDAPAFGGLSFVAGFLDGAASFDGIDDVAQAPRTIGADFTVSFWMKTTAIAPTGVNWFEGFGLVDAEVCGSPPGGDWGIGMLNGGRVVFGNSSTLSDVNDDQWHSVAVTRRIADDRFEIWIDGVREISLTGILPGLELTGPPWIGLGNNPCDASFGRLFYPGLMDEVRFYDRVLTDVEVGRLTRPAFQLPPPAGSGVGDRFGAAVASDGALVAVGLPGSDDAGPDAGLVAVYRVEGSDLVFDSVISVPDGRSATNFGAALAMDGASILVGAPRQPSTVKGPPPDLQAAIFRRAAGGWTLSKEFSSSGSDDAFGTSVALDGDLAVIGAPGDGGGEGAAYLFEVDGSNMQQLKPAHPGTGNRFGHAVSASKGKVAVGAPGGMVANAATGSVHLYQLIGGNLSDINASDPLTGSEAAADAQFGTSVALDGDALIVGAPGEGQEAGAAYLFAVSGGSVLETGRAEAEGSNAGDRFGAAVALSGAEIAIGSPGFSTGAGRVFRYDPALSLQDIVPNQGAQMAFGSAVSLFGSRLAIGAPTTGTGTGAAAYLGVSEHIFSADFE